MQTGIAIHDTDRHHGSAMNSNPNRGNNRKQRTMNAITKTALVVVLVTLGLVLTAEPAEPLPYGHSSFVPTPERPVYFRQNNACYPGATPPLEWWDGTPTTRKVKGVFGNPPRHREMDVLDFADTTSKNIRWKAELLRSR